MKIKLSQSDLVKRIKKITLLQTFIIFVVIASTVFVVKYFGKRAEWRLVEVQVIGKDWSNSYVDYAGYRPPYWLTESIKEGDVELGTDGSKMAEVVKVERYERGGSEYDLYLTLNLKGALNTRTDKYVYKGRAIEVGAPIDIRLDNTYVLAQVIDNQVPEGGYPTKEVIVTGRLRDVEPWVISNLNVGDIMTDGSPDGFVAEILSINTEPAQSQLFLPSSGGNLTIQRNPRIRDLVLTARVVVERHNDGWFFAGHQNIKSGNFLWLYFPEVNLRSIEIESVENLVPDENSQK